MDRRTKREASLNKVDQMDAFMIDEQSKMLLKSTLVSVFPQKWVIKRPHEIQLLLDFLFFRLTTARGKQTPGQKLQNLRFAFKSNKQMISLLAFQVFAPYLLQKLMTLIQRLNWSNPDHVKRGSTLLQKFKFFIAKVVALVSQLQKVAELANFLGFMSNGVLSRFGPYRRNIAETVLQVDLARQDPSQTQRSLSFQYVHILVVWTSLGRSLAYLLPFLDFSRLRQLLMGGSSTLTQTFAFSQSADSSQSDTLCTICGSTSICMPYRATPCKCVFCYYCLQSRLQQLQGKDSKVDCPKCTQAVTGLQKLDLSAAAH